MSDAIKVDGGWVYTTDPRYKKSVKVGEIHGDTFYKSVTSKNYMKVLDGYGIQKNVFDSLPHMGIKNITVFEIHTGDKFTASHKMWVDNGRAADYGNGKQQFLSLKFMERVVEK